MIPSSFYIQGFPRIGRNRELKKIIESYFNRKLTEAELLGEYHNLETERWKELSKAGVGTLPAGEFSLYDSTLDAAFSLGMVPSALRSSGLSDTAQYFAMARGYQDDTLDFRAMPMQKWFTTNYHYVVPAYTEDMVLRDASPAFLEIIARAKLAGKEASLRLTGPFTLYVLSDCVRDLRSGFLHSLIKAYCATLTSLARSGVTRIHLDESILASDRSKAFADDFQSLYTGILELEHRPEICVHTSFGDVSPLWTELASLKLDGLGLDFVDGPENIRLLKETVPSASMLYLGLINGKNIWKSDYYGVREKWKSIEAIIPPEKALILSSTCSLQFVPYSASRESGLPEALQLQLAFADEKIKELVELSGLLQLDEKAFLKNPLVIKNSQLLQSRSRLSEIDLPGGEYQGWNPDKSWFARSTPRAERLKIQKRELNLPLLPTTTIGSFPQTPEIRRVRAAFRKKAISEDEYNSFLRKKIAEVVKKQDDIGLDVLVHGEFERNDMVEYFAQFLSGFAFTEFGWVQSYGVRAVKPPIIFGDIARKQSITLHWTRYAQSLTEKPMKAMLTGPITIYNWSFPAEHLPFEKVINELGLALRREILELENGGIRIIQLDEAALRERLPLQEGKARDEYLRIAVGGFRLATAGVSEHTQVHTHMCYSDFGSIYDSIIGMDADVITIEAAKSGLSIIHSIKNKVYPAEIGPGVFDIHSPRIPGTAEMAELIRTMIETLEPGQCWVNPDCGLKTRGESEAWESLVNMVEAAKTVRSSL